MSSPFRSICDFKRTFPGTSLSRVLGPPFLNLDQFYLQRLTNSSSSDPVSEVPFPFFTFSIGLTIARVDRANTISTPSRLQCSNRILP